jgi:hypothetical protein
MCYVETCEIKNENNTSMLFQNSECNVDADMGISRQNAERKEKHSETETDIDVQRSRQRYKIMIHRSELLAI